MESTGMFRDMISTHLFQLLAFVAIEPPGGSTRTACATRW
jgi:glucose-6-phosphate 1-dehydrogenase